MRRGRGDAPPSPSRLVSISPLDELVSGPAEAKEYGRMQRAIGEALGSVKAVKPPPFSIDELYWATRKLQAHEAWAAHGEWISVKGRRIGQAIYDRFAFGKTVTSTQAAQETEKRGAFPPAAPPPLARRSPHPWRTSRRCRRKTPAASYLREKSARA